jgi:steroid 5-alpha reductase family enzyme
MWVVSLPLQLGIAASLGSGDAAAATMGLGLQLAGCGLWVIGLFFETVGDWQLTKFKANSDNRGRVLDTGLWRYTRHPNYFGDCLVWWGFFLIAFGLGGPAWTIIGPLIMTILLLKVSGVALLEKSLSANKPGYAEYVRRTSSFFPLPPKIL